MNTNWKV